MSNQISIACLPVAGKKNPYQYLMIDGLNQSSKINAYNGIDDRFFGILKTIVHYKPTYLHFDWITSYYLRRTLGLTLLLLPLFYFQIIYVHFFTKTKLVWTLHNITPHNAKHIRLHNIIRRFFASKMTWIRVFSETSIQKAVIELKVPTNKFKVIPEGSYISEYPDSITKTEARAALNINQYKTVFLYLGFIRPYKGLENLILQFSKIKNDDVVLLIAGQNMNTEYLNGLEKLITKKKESRVRLIPEFISVERLQIFYNAADAVVLPFDKVENSGSVIMAMGFKKAILAPKIGVLTKRLHKQEFLLYNKLKEGLDTIFTIDKRELVKIGLQNFEALNEYKWEDFNKCFTE